MNQTKFLTLPEIVEQAILEDMPNGDLTTESLAIASQMGEAKLVAKEDLVISGKAPFEQTMKTLDPNIEFSWYFAESDWVLKGQTIALLTGHLDQILKAERVALNFLGLFSGIATLTRCFVKQTEGTNCRILDTRKTSPLLRNFAKKAVSDGGGLNHRLHLSDAILIKENHIAFAGGIRSAISKIQKNFQGPIEVEIRNSDELGEAIKMGVDRVLLDNMNLEEMKDALKSLPLHIESEASGNMTLERISDVAKLGVNYISVGALTHSAPCVDLSLLFQWQEK